MSKLYNPELVPKEEIKRTFVGRHKLVEEIVSTIENQPEGAGVQHLVIVAPRGMGKTTMVFDAAFYGRRRRICRKIGRASNFQKKVTVFTNCRIFG